MLGWILYLGAAAIAAILMMFAVSVVFAGPKNPDFSPLKSLIICFVIAVFAPFGYVEILSRIAGPQLKPAIVKAYDASPIVGPLQYFRVTWYTGTTAKAFAVGSERTIWGETDRPILAVDLKKVNGTWKVNGTNLVHSDAQNDDGVLFPPYG